MGRPVVLVPGTWAWRGRQTHGEWYQPGEGGRVTLYDVLVADGWSPLVFPWTTRANGLPWLRHPHLDWEAAGANLAVFLDPRRPDIGTDAPCPVVAHSHGLQPVLFSAALYGATPTMVMSVCSPVRADLAEVAALARPRIGYWAHLYNTTGWWAAIRDMQILGGFGDRMLGAQRRAEWRAFDRLWTADVQIDIDGAGHSGVLHTTPYVDWWESLGWLDLLASPPPSLLREGVPCG